MDISDESLKLHYKLGGKIEIKSRYSIKNKKDLSLVYTPGVAKACREIERDCNKSFELTRRANLVAVITDGTAVLGLGNIGPSAAMPVMEGKCALFKEFAGIDAFPICIDSTDVEEIVETIRLISKSFGGINLEDISAPRCFEIEKRLKEVCDIPVFHDDQHGTAIVVAAALLNSIKITHKKMGSVKIIINGAGAAGIAIAKLLINMKFGDIVLCDINGIICRGDASLNEAQKEISKLTNKNLLKGNLEDALKGADVFIGVSAPNLMNKNMISKMNSPIIFALANPTPEVSPEEAIAGGAIVVGTGRSDLKNQINNVLAFPGIFKGVLRSGVRFITEEIKEKAAYAIASMVNQDQLNDGIVIPDALNRDVAEAVARAVESCVKKIEM